MVMRSGPPGSEPCRYTVVRENQILLVICASCGVTMLTKDQAARLVHPVFGVAGPLGRFMSPAKRPERIRLAALIQAALETWPTNEEGD